jgi:hypothetical protein
MNQREAAFITELTTLLDKYEVEINLEHGDDDYISTDFISVFAYTQWDQVTQHMIHEGINMDLLLTLQEYYKGAA